MEDATLVVQDDKGNTVEAQFIEFDNITSNLRSFYTEAYLGISPTEVPKYWLLFQASVPPLGWNTYFITKTSGKGTSNAHTTISRFLRLSEYVKPH